VGFAPSSSPGATAPPPTSARGSGDAERRHGRVGCRPSSSSPAHLLVPLSPQMSAAGKRDKCRILFLLPFGIWLLGEHSCPQSCSVRQAQLCSQWMRCVTGRCGFNHSVGVRCTRRAPILDLHGALILFVFVIYYVVGGRAAVPLRSQSFESCDGTPSCRMRMRPRAPAGSITERKTGS
jgi:hypothetical protein